MVEKEVWLACAIALAAIACEPASAPVVTMVPKEDAAPPIEAAAPATASASSPTPPPPTRFSNQVGLQAAVDRAGPGGIVALVVRIDPKTAPTTAEQRRTALAAAGLAPQTVAGDVATLRMPSERFEALQAIPWITAAELPSVKYPR